MQLTVFDAIMENAQLGCSTKTYPESSAPKTTPSAPFWADYAEATSPSMPPLMDGRVRVWLLGRPALSHGGYWMPSTSEWPSDGSASLCSLSEVLEAGPVQTRYFLSATACKGILRRADKRGKDLPTALLRALQQVAEASNDAETPEDKTL